MATALKKEFKDKLVKLGCYDKFMSNFKKFKYGKTMSALNNYESFHELVYGAFVWDLTPEKHEFWENIANS